MLALDNIGAESAPLQEQENGERVTEFENILVQIKEMHDKKQEDYGREGDPFANVRASEDFGIPGWVGCMTRAHDKMVRLQKAARGGTMTNESVEDSLLDLAVYSIIALVLRREENASTRLPDGAITVDTGRDSYFATGAGCSGPHLGRQQAREGGSNLGRGDTTLASVKPRADFKSPSPSESKRIGDILFGEDSALRWTYRAGVPWPVGLVPET